MPTPVRSELRSLRHSRMLIWLSRGCEKLLALYPKSLISERKDSKKNLSINAYMTEKMNKSASFYVILAFLSIEFEVFCVFLQSHSANECKDILLDSHTITTVEIRANLHIGTVPFTGADFPYLKVVCGEPCDVWRKSAPLF